MQSYWLRDRGNDSVIIFVLGWSCDYGCVAHLLGSIPAHYDIVCIYDYRDISTQLSGRTDINILNTRISTYRKHYLFAWSFGVWVAEHVFANCNFDRSVALCGSPHPVSAEFGIEPKRLIITIKGVTKHGSDEFNRRTYGTYYDQIKSRLTPRSAESNIEELATLNNAASAPYTPTIEWSRAIIGEYDVIFPVENLLRYWGIRAQVLPLPHYPFENARLILDELDIR